MTGKNKKTSPPKNKKEVEKSSENKRQTTMKLPNSNIDIFQKYGDYLFGIMLFVGAFIVYKDFLLFNKLFLYEDIGSDTINIFYPNIYQLSNYFRESGIPAWSFYQGIGYDIYPAAFSDPFNLILCMLPTEKLAYGIGYAEFLKVILSGIIFYAYIQTINENKFVANIGGLLAAFSGFLILGSGWYTFSYQALQIIFLLFSIERLLVRNQWFWVVISIALLSISLPFNLFTISIFILLYTIIRLTDLEEISTKKIFIFYGKIFFLGIIAVGLSGFNLLSQLLQMLDSPRGAGDFSFAEQLKSQGVFSLDHSIFNGGIENNHYKTIFYRFFSNDILGSGSEFKGWYNYLEAPILYIGIITLLLVPQIFIHASKKQKIAYSSLLVVFAIVLIFPYFRYAFWLFTGDYFRALGFIISLTMLFFSIKVLLVANKEKILNNILLISTSAVLLLLLSIPFYSDSVGKVLNTNILNSVRILIVVYTILLLLYNNSAYQQIAKYGLLLVIFVEIISFSFITLNNRELVSAREFESKTGYNDYTVEAINYIKANDTNFYRVQKDYYSGTAQHSSLNDALVQKFYGTAVYGSFNSNKYVKFLTAVNQINPTDETQSRWVTGLAYRPLLQSFASVKYYLSKGADAMATQRGFRVVETFNDVQVLQNEYALPFGFTYDTYMREEEFAKFTNPFQKDYNLLRCCVVGNEELLPQLKEFTELSSADSSQIFDFVIYDSLTNRLREDTLQISEFSQNNIKGKISLQKPKLLFFSIINNSGWKAFVNDKAAELYMVNIGFSALLLPAGEHNVELLFEPPMRKIGIFITLAFGLVFLGLLFLKKKMMW